MGKVKADRVAEESAIHKTGFHRREKEGGEETVPEDIIQLKKSEQFRLIK
jgi:hypothetical protein